MEANVDKIKQENTEIRCRNVKKQNLDKDQSKNIEVHDEVLHTERKLEAGTYWLTRILLLRSVGFVYFVAFLVALHQNKALIGKNGLLPADKHLNNIKRYTKDESWLNFQHAPTLLWLFDYENNIDSLLDTLAWCGLALSSFVVIMGSANIVIMLVLWLLYHSIVNVGQRWYGFGWESQILETGFLAAFLCPLLNIKRFPLKTPASFIVILGFRWLIFRIMIGAGLIKIRGDQCWRDLTCMNYHYETQPVPNPMSTFMHQAPEPWHKFETLSNHFVELVAPFLMLLTRRFRITGGMIQIFFQIVLIISGNLSFLNWLTMIPSIACFDDASIQWMFSRSTRHRVWQIQQEKLQPRGLGNIIRTSFNICLGALLAYLSAPIVQNLLSTRQVMNTSFDPLRIVNTYGAFGSITKERTEVIFQGTDAADPSSPAAVWLDYEFKCKPGNVTRRPCLISPYHYRLDWLMWFAAFQSYQLNPWLVHLAAKFLINDEPTTDLIAYNPFKDRDPPRWVRAEHYRYHYTEVGSKAYSEGKWWKRRRIGEYLPIVSLETLDPYIKQQGWSIPRLERSDIPKSRKKRV